MDEANFTKLWTESGLDAYHARMHFLESLGFNFLGHIGEMEDSQSKALDSWLREKSIKDQVETELKVVDVTEDELRCFAKEFFSVDKREIVKKVQESIDYCSNLSKIRLGYAKDYAYAAIVTHRHKGSEESREKAIQESLWHDGSGNGCESAVSHLSEILKILQ